MIFSKNLFNTQTAKLIFLNILIFVAALITLALISSETFLSLFALQPAIVMQGQNLWTILTSMFLHLSLGHLLANMVSLFFIGTFVERIIGKKRFIWFYLIAGIFAAVFYASLSYFFGASILGARVFGPATQFAVGASGAIFGLLGLLAMLTPKNRVYLIAGPIVAIVAVFIIQSVITNSSLSSILDLLVTFYFIFSVFAIFSFNENLRRFTLPVEMEFWVLPFVAIIPLVVVGLFVQLPIGNAAHFGGLLIGLAYGFYLRKKYPKKTAKISRHFT